MATQPFLWGAGGRAMSYTEAQHNKKVAEALRSRIKNPQTMWEGIQSAVGDIGGGLLDWQANKAEEEGRSAVADALLQAQGGSDPNAYISILGNEFASPAQSAVAQALLQRGWSQQDRAAADAVPDFNTFEQGGDIYRWNEKDPNAKPELFFDGPDELAQTDMPANVQEWEYYNQLSTEDQAAYLIMKRSNPYLNTGTEFVQPNPASPGTIAGPAIPIDNQTPSYDKAFGGELGKGLGEKLLSADAAKTELDQSIAAIENLKSPEIAPGLDEWFNQAGALPRGMWVQGGSNMAKFKVAADNVIDRSWLSARAGLKGGGPITDYESNKAENAVSMMKGALEKGDKAQYLAAVDEYEYWIKAGFAKLQGQTEAAANGGTPTGAPTDDIDGILSGLGI